jgi:hypothetical protein
MSNSAKILIVDGHADRVDQYKERLADFIAQGDVAVAQWTPDDASRWSNLYLFCHHSTNLDSAFRNGRAPREQDNWYAFKDFLKANAGIVGSYSGGEGAPENWDEESRSFRCAYDRMMSLLSQKTSELSESREKALDVVREWFVDRSWLCRELLPLDILVQGAWSAKGGVETNGWFDLDGMDWSRLAKTLCSTNALEEGLCGLPGVKRSAVKAVLFDDDRPGLIGSLVMAIHTRKAYEKDLLADQDRLKSYEKDLLADQDRLWKTHEEFVSLVKELCE